MVALKIPIVITLSNCENTKNIHLLSGCNIVNFGRSYFIQDFIISMRLVDSEILVVQVEADNPATTIHQGENECHVNCDKIINAHGSGTNQFEKMLWKSTLWQSISAPPSPTAMSLQSTFNGFENIQTTKFPFIPRLKSTQNGNKFCVPPLQPPQWSTKENEECDSKSGQWLLETPGCRRGMGLIGTDMKLDLGAVQRNRDTCEPTEMQLKRDKFAFFDKECSQILDHVFLGSDAVARNRKTLREKGITHILNCVGFVCPEYFSKDLSYKTLWLQDNPSEDITSILYDVFDYFEEVREEGGRVFVHCCQGVSRSTSLVIAYLMWLNRRTFEDAFQDVKATRGVTNPNMGFACQLLQYQKRVHAVPISPKSTVRMYRMAPHSPYDPMHLVPKTINNPQPTALDSRGAFVVLIPNALFAWQGSKCDMDMASAAHHFICQVIRYEKTKGSILHIIEGNEPHEFWATFKKGNFHDNNTVFNLTKNVENENGLLNRAQFTCESLNLLTKKVSSYDEDFEIYLKAKHGKPEFQNIEAGLFIQGPRDSGWGCLRRKHIIDKLESKYLRSENFFLDTNIELATEVEAPISEVKYDKKCEKINLTVSISRPTSSPDASSQCSSAESSILSHSFSSNSSQSPSVMTSLCLSPPPSPTPSFSKTPSPKFSFMWSPTVFRMCYPTLSTSTHASSSTNDNLSNQSNEEIQNSKNSSPSISSSILEKSSNVLAPLNLSNIIVDENASNLNSKKSWLRHPSTISNESIMEHDPMVLESNDKFVYNMMNAHIETSNKQTSNVCINQSERFTSSSKAYCSSFQREDKAESSASGSSRVKQDNNGFVALPSLFEWPQMEKIDMFDADDLDSDAAFVLLVPGTSDGRSGHLYLWVGSSLQIKSDDQNSPLDDGDIEQQNEEHWQNIGRDLACQLQLRHDIHVEVVIDGKEPNEFWDYFING